MKCKRCGNEMEKVGECKKCIWEEVKERRSISWGTMIPREVLILDEKLEKKYADAGRVRES